MKIVSLIVSGIVTILLILLFNTKMLLPVPLGQLLSPQKGLWQNAESIDKDYSAQLSFPQLQGKVKVYFDARLVPHVFAANNNDAYFVQGYLHAKFRLWQMEFQTRAAAGRLSEIIGPKALDYDRDKRRLGMVYAAENSLKAIENDPETLAECDSYTAGVNAYIESLTESSLPVEYKLLAINPKNGRILNPRFF